jgi:hypothetical protein
LALKTVGNLDSQMDAMTGCSLVDGLGYLTDYLMGKMMVDYLGCYLE